MPDTSQREPMIGDVVIYYDHGADAGNPQGGIVAPVQRAAIVTAIPGDDKVTLTVFRHDRMPYMTICEARFTGTQAVGCWSWRPNG